MKNPINPDVFLFTDEESAKNFISSHELWELNLKPIVIGDVPYFWRRYSPDESFMDLWVLEYYYKTTCGGVFLYSSSSDGQRFYHSLPTFCFPK